VGDGFNLHGGAGTASVERVVVGVERHGERIGRASDGVGRLEHLTGVERMRVRVIVAEGLRGLKEYGLSGVTEIGLWAGRQMAEAGVEMPLRLGEKFKEVVGLEV
jgi:hypothetical protein